MELPFYAEVTADRYKCRGLDIAVGDRSGRLVVEFFTRKHQRPMISCRCDCGCPVLVRPHNFARSVNRSCGCWLRQSLARLSAAQTGVPHTPERIAAMRSGRWPNKEDA